MSRHHNHTVGRRRRRIVVGVLVGLLVVVAGTAGGFSLLAARLNSHVGRIQGAFDGIPERMRPPVTPVYTGTTILLGGLDTRSDEPVTGSAATVGPGDVPGGGRTDVLMLVHISADGRSVGVVSIPRDSWVDIPDHGKNKINAAYVEGGPPLLIRTVEALTGVRIDHFGVIDFYGLKAIVDAVGGVDVQIASDTPEGRARGLYQGRNHLDGERALGYVRQRHDLPQGDFDRERRQQNLIRTIIAKVSTVDPLHDPVRMYRLLDAGTRSVSVDDGFPVTEMRTLATNLIGLNAGNIAFVLAPVGAVNQEGPQTVVRLYQPGCQELWDAIKNDTMADYVERNKTALLPAVPQ